MKRIFTLISILLLLSACGEENIMDGHKGFNKKDHHFISESYDDVMDGIENKEEAIYYFGYSDCPVCTDLVPVLEDVLTEVDETAIYVDVSQEEFSKIAERFQEFDQSLPENMQSEGGVPFVVVIDDDESIRTHRGTVLNYNPGQDEMDEDQIKYLSIKLTQAIQGE